MKKIFLIKQIASCFKYKDLIIHIATSDIKLKYSKTILGPLWNSLSMGIFVVAFGFVGSRLWGLDVKNFMPFFCAGFITWTFIATTISESTSILSNHSDTLKSIKTPYLIFIVSMVIKNMIIFLHHILIFFLICLLLSYDLSIYCLYFIPSLLIVTLIGILFSFSWSILCTRFNDLTPLTTNLLQVLFFLTPVFWPAERLQGIYFKLIIELNPMYQILRLIRDPLLGNNISMNNLLGISLILGILFLLSIFVGNKFKNNIIYFI
jgi:ABC-type polysaccharide/polyol phosphate export permease